MPSCRLCLAIGSVASSAISGTFESYNKGLHIHVGMKKLQWNLSISATIGTSSFGRYRKIIHSVQWPRTLQHPICMCC